MAFSGTQRTRLGLIAIPRALYGSFAGKSGSAAPVLYAGLHFAIKDEPRFAIAEPIFALKEDA